ncbi:hypothetical protein NKR23_g10036 [Pleurostoma richardsiae]|uniref:Uncharacterized protein n=1 Tax=Pleurostoma richardsiae TaxID=41990 RepID=A0AA38RNN4_9PEZI|nr:hypothetical protein NKR23_g10036 [Pleurostoma richardsiae]
MATNRGLASSRWASSSAWRSSSLPSLGRNPTHQRTTAPPVSTAASAPSVAHPSNGTSEPVTTRGPGTPSAAAELMRYTKIVRRLKWKLPFLAHGYHQATFQVDACTEVERPQIEAQVAEAELMFKLDFFEYYMLIERALVHLLGVFGITISRDFAERHLEAMLEEQKARQKAHQQQGRNGHDTAPVPSARSDHRYHANVLEALDNVENPLHEALGMGDVRRQLGRAKDLRNRWKNADDGVDPARAAAAPLESYDLERILETIFEGFDRGYLVAEQFVLEEQQRQAAAGMSEPSWDTEEQQWEFMVDAMDWEAV